ncbi:PadR family transcriptional regulator [Streptomyces sp. NA04227]|uniref:PadR family transcriptional regulator n=1 Tax=Streptomyces sp. NA04227 TaxID=2742136 RepID=UPI001590CA00|nr:PadR family transcriptional regulator [Streptomyces sp. NA04227]QKW10128.1 PadR family transcriptional regulator [Streptomyces sp. NA04227]
MNSSQGAWIRACLQLCLLGVLDTEGESYGYALINRLAESGLGEVKPATLYPALTRLAEEGAVSVRWSPGENGPGRKYYAITDQGRARLAAERADWQHFTTTVATLTGAP